jgi:hypothetical protein
VQSKTRQHHLGILWLYDAGWYPEKQNMVMNRETEKERYRKRERERDTERERERDTERETEKERYRKRERERYRKREREIQKMNFLPCDGGDACM